MANVMEDAVTGVYTFINADSGTFPNVYARHDTADMTLPAVTVGPEVEQAFPPDTAQFEDDTTVNHEVVISVRVHTSYIEGPLATATAMTYGDNLIEKLRANVNATATYRIMNVESIYNQTFTESATEGMSLLVTLHIHVHHVQE